MHADKVSSYQVRGTIRDRNVSFGQYSELQYTIPLLNLSSRQNAMSSNKKPLTWDVAGT